MASSLNYRPFVFQLAILDQCKAWIASMMVMLGARWKPPMSITILAWDLEASGAWGTCIAITIPTSISSLGNRVAWNEISWTSDFAQIPLVGQFAPRLHVSIVVCMFCVASPFCVNTFPYHIYYVIHKFQSLSRVVIHLGTHEHHVVEGMCREYLEEIKVLVEGQVFHTLNTKIFTIALNASKAFLAHHLFNDNGEGRMEITW